MDETPGHAADEPEKEPEGGALPPRAGDPEPVEVFGPANRLDNLMRDVAAVVASHQPIGVGKPSLLTDDQGNVVGIRIHPGRPTDYDTYLDRPWAMRNLTYDDWAKLHAASIPASSSEPADVTIGGEPPRWLDSALGAILRRIIASQDMYVDITDNDVCLDGTVTISAAEAVLLRALPRP